MDTFEEIVLDPIEDIVEDVIDEAADIVYDVVDVLEDVYEAYEEDDIEKVEDFEDWIDENGPVIQEWLNTTNVTVEDVVEFGTENITNYVEEHYGNATAGKDNNTVEQRALTQLSKALILGREFFRASDGGKGGYGASSGGALYCASSGSGGRGQWEAGERRKGRGGKGGGRGGDGHWG